MQLEGASLEPLHSRSNGEKAEGMVMGVDREGVCGNSLPALQCFPQKRSQLLFES